MEIQPVITAKYLKIVEWVRSEIQSGALRSGDRLPSESELCERFSVSRTAVRQALGNLSREGLVESRKGIGSFCTGRRTASSTDFAFVCYFAGSYIFPRLVTGFERAVQRAGYHMVINQSENDLEKERSILLRLRDKGVAGIAIIPINFGGGAGGDDGPTNCQLLKEIRDSGIPVVLLDNSFLEEPFPSIVMDDTAFGVAAAAYLADRGHRHIGMIYARNHKPFLLRKDGFMAELVRRGIHLDASSVLALDRADDHGPTLDAFIGAKDRPSAIFCANDEIAITLYKAAGALGLRIPQDISVISADNSDYAVLPGIALTSIDHPSKFIGEKAAEMLLEAHDPRGVRFRNSIVIDPSIVERSSVRTVNVDEG